jgi:hypothetical protein
MVVTPPSSARSRTNKRVQIETNLSVPEHSRDFRPAIASLLLGVRYRGYLVTSDQELLDELAGDKGIAFLLRGQTYLHPANIELFPPQEIATAMNAGSGCVFSQTRRSTSNGQHTYFLMTVALGPESNDRLIFGTLIPLGMRRDQTAISRFHGLARQFEEAWRESSRLAEHIDKQVEPQTSWLLVNRASGRTVAVSASASQILKRNGRDLIDVEFGRVREALAPMIARTTLTMRTVESELLPLCVVCLESRVSRPDQTDLGAFMVHKMRNKISSIYTASSYLQSTACWKCESDEAELARIIESEVSELDQQLHRFYLLFGYDKMEKIPTNLAEALKGRADAIRAARTTVQKLRMDWCGDSATVKVPAGSVESMFESIIQAHTQDYVEPAAIEVAVEIESNAATITVRTSLQRDHPHLAPAIGWSALAERLAALMNGTTTQDTDKENGVISTKLRIPLSDE